MSRFDETLRAHRAAVDAVGARAEQVIAAAQRIAACLEAGGTVYWLGNGGSAADSQHLAAELVGRFEGADRRGLASVALTTDTSVLTSVANDFGFEQVFARQIRALCRPGDVVVAISTSGGSANVLAAADAARAAGAYTIGLCGSDGGELARRADIAIVVPVSSPARAQEAHILIGHIWCDYVDARVREGSNDET
ncbi:MAG: D-sedoheptulose-7-phosphate isomerase [Gemmatimonadota bacterium]